MSLKSSSNNTRTKSRLTYRELCRSDSTISWGLSLKQDIKPRKDNDNGGDSDKPLSSIIVLSVVPSSPAALANVQLSSEIIGIDSVDVRSWEWSQIISKLRQPDLLSIKLSVIETVTVKRPREEAVPKKKIVRTKSDDAELSRKSSDVSWARKSQPCEYATMNELQQCQNRTAAVPKSNHTIPASGSTTAPPRASKSLPPPSSSSYTPNVVK